jgi:hypothetical protein
MWVSIAACQFLGKRRIKAKKRIEKHHELAIPVRRIEKPVTKKKHHELAIYFHKLLHKKTIANDCPICAEGKSHIYKNRPCNNLYFYLQTSKQSDKQMRRGPRFTRQLLRYTPISRSWTRKRPSRRRQSWLLRLFSHWRTAGLLRRPDLLLQLLS